MMVEVPMFLLRRQINKKSASISGNDTRNTVNDKINLLDTYLDDDDYLVKFFSMTDGQLSVTSAENISEKKQVVQHEQT